MDRDEIGSRETRGVISSLAFILNGRRDDEFLIRGISLHFFKIIFIHICIFANCTSPTDLTMNETFLEMLHYYFFFFSFISLCISQLSTLLTYTSIEFRSFLFHLRDFSLSSAHRDVVLLQERCNIIPKNTVTVAIPFFNYLSSSIPFSDRAHVV